MQRMAELMEERVHLVVCQQRGLAISRLRDVQVDAHHGLVAGQAVLRHIGIHPRAAPLVRAGIEIA